jgi:hypothetical protein
MNEALQSQVEAYASGMRDSAQEQELARLLRQLPEEDRFAIVERCLSINSRIGLLFARKCLSQPRYFRAILVRGVETADAHNMGRWLQCAVPPLGWGRVFHVLEEMVKTHPRGVKKTLYHLPALMSPLASSARARYSKLCDLLED